MARDIPLDHSGSLLSFHPLIFRICASLRQDERLRHRAVHRTRANPVMRCDLSRFRANCGRIGPSRERFLPLRASIQPTIPASPYNGWNKSAGQSLVHYRCFMEVEMRTVWALSALLLTVLATPASAKGCLKGAVVGGAAGHYAGHHGVIGAAAGCLIGRHQARKRTYVEPSMRQSGDGRI